MPSARPSLGPRPDRARRTGLQPQPAPRSSPGSALVKARPACLSGVGVLGPWPPQRQAWAGTQPAPAQSTGGTFQGSEGVGGSRGPSQAGGGGRGAGYVPSPCPSLRRCMWPLLWAPSPLTPRGGPGAASALAALPPASGRGRIGRVVSGPQPRSQHAHTAAGGLQPSGNIPKTQGQDTTTRKHPHTDTQACLLR